MKYLSKSAFAKVAGLSRMGVEYHLKKGTIKSRIFKINVEKIAESEIEKLRKVVRGK